MFDRRRKSGHFGCKRRCGCELHIRGNRRPIYIKEARLSDDAQESSSDTLQIIYLPETDELLLMVEPAIRLSRENPGDG